MSQRETMECDAVVVGAGPAGLAAALRLRELAAAKSREFSVIVLEKGAEVGAHILSGLVMDPVGLDALVPDWRDAPDFPLKTRVSQESYRVLTAGGSCPLPVGLLPKSLKNIGFPVGSLGKLCRWLAARAEQAGVEIYPGFAAVELLREGERVVGVRTGDMGVDRDGRPKPSFTPGMDLRARFTVLAEGARGSLSAGVISAHTPYAGGDPQKYALGIKEVWRLRPGAARPGLVEHTLGFPLGLASGGGGFLYHYDDALLAVGLVTLLDYSDPTLSPFDEFQRFKNHPAVRELLEAGERLEYGARVICEGGLQAVPQLSFPGGALVGDCAGFVNSPRIKGSHNALLSGVQCAESLMALMDRDRGQDEPLGYDLSWRESAIGRDLGRAKNFRPMWARFGVPGLAAAGLDLWLRELLPFSPFGTLRLKRTDREGMKPLKDVKPRPYDPPDNVVTFDRPSSLALANVAHEENQPCHLRLKDPTIPLARGLPLYGEPSRLYCPAAVYEIITADGAPRFVINAANCLHCKTCDIKDPFDNIRWTPPEGGGGPNYQEM
jgi:electron-transferring-flavoprotein dehydrogenase